MSLFFQGPPSCCHLICCLLAYCWQWPGPLPHPEQEEQHLLPLDCCLVLPADLHIYMCVCARAQLQRVEPCGLSDAWKAVWLAAGVSPSLQGLCVGLASLSSAALFPALFAFGRLVFVGLKDPALCQMLFPPVSNPLKASSSVGLEGFQESVSPFFGESQCCFCQTSCPVLGSGLCTHVPIAACRPC